jgi:hypothetical protein
MGFTGFETDTAGGAKRRDNGEKAFLSAGITETGFQGSVPVRFHIDPAFHAFSRKKKGLNHPEEETPCPI